MKIVVQKYGGSSVKDIEMLEYVIKKIKTKLKEDYKVVVVVSAQGKTTDKLEELSKQYGAKKNSQELDMLLATGELVSASLLTMQLKKNGIESVAFSGADLGIITDSNYGNAGIKAVYPDKIIAELEKENVVVATGFQGIDRKGYITTLGRGGSDLTAIVIAKALKAELCEIYSDIDGVYTADPRIITKAKLLEKISLEEMLELATSGAKVLHNGSVIAFKNSKAKLYVKNTKNDSAGTEIVDTKEVYGDDEKIKITKKDNLSKVTIVGHGYISRPGKVKEIVDIIDSKKIAIYMMQITEISVSILVEADHAETIMDLLHKRYNE